MDPNGGTMHLKKVDYDQIYSPYLTTKWQTAGCGYISLKIFPEMFYSIWIVQYERKGSADQR